MAFQIIDLCVVLFLEELFPVFFQWCFYFSAALTAHVCTLHDGFNQTQEMVLGALLLSEILFKFLFLRWKAFLFCLIAVINSKEECLP